MNNLAINRELPNNLLTIDQSAYFNVEKKQLKYTNNDIYYKDSDDIKECK